MQLNDAKQLRKNRCLTPRLRRGSFDFRSA